MIKKVRKNVEKHMAIVVRLTCCASLAAAAARPVSTDATLAPSLAGRSCLGRVGITRAVDGRKIRS